MPRGGLPNYKMRLEPILDKYVMMSIELANGEHNADTGHYATLTIEGATSRDSAHEIVKALNRSAYHLNKKLQPKVGIAYKIIKKSDRTYDVEFRAVHKSYAKAYVIQTYGEDPKGWPYWSRMKADK